MRQTGELIYQQTESTVPSESGPQLSQVNLGTVVASLSRALDLSTSRLFLHSQRVAYIALHLADRLQVELGLRRSVFLASLLHDVGITSEGMRQELTAPMPPVSATATHCKQGAELLAVTEQFRHLAPIVLHHHDRWQDVEGDLSQPVVLSSQLIHLADRIEVLIPENEYILYARPQIVKQIEDLSGTHFPSRLVAAFQELALTDAFWFDLVTGEYEKYLAGCGCEMTTSLTLTDLQEIANLFASIIDSRSRFTARHSRGVASVSRYLARLFQFSDLNVNLMEVAGLLHDLGKLAVPGAILDHPGKLNDRQILLMHQHTYWTYHLLDCLQLPQIQEWAAYHHEKLDGTGYPFRLKGPQLSLGARIMAVSDILQALLEPRPYRAPMPPEKAKAVLFSLADGRKLDPRVVEIATSNLDAILENLDSR